MVVRHSCSFILVAIFTLTLSTTVATQAQEPAAARPFDSSAPQPTEYTGITITKRVDEVNVVFTGTDSRGRFISNLPQSSFQVLDNHRAPQTVEYFVQQTELPLRVALLIDLSGSIRGRFEFE